MIVHRDFSLAQMRAMRLAGLTREHARALGRIEDARLREAALIEMAYLRLPAEAAEKYVDAILRFPAR